MIRKLLLSRAMRPVGTGIAVIAVVILGLVILNLIGPGLSRLAGGAWSKISARVISVSTPAPVIVEQIQSLNRLETVRQTSSHVVEAKSEGLPLPDFLVKDKIMMMVQTEVVAGVDLGKVTSEDIRIEGKTITLQLPAPEIFTIRIDDNASRVYNRERGWIVFNPNPDLERQARIRAQENARRAASQSEVLSAARANAEQNLRTLLQPIGFEKIEFRWKDMGITSGRVGGISSRFEVPGSRLVGPQAQV